MGKIRKFQEGGSMTPVAPEPGGGQQDPMTQLMQLAAQAVETDDCNAAKQVCTIVLQVLQQGGQEGGGQPTPQEQPGEPVYRRGGKLLRRF